MSWDKIKLGEVCTIEKGTTGILKAIPGEFPMVVTGKGRKSHNEYQFDDEAVIVSLVSGTGHGHASIKRIHFQRGKFALGSILCAIIPKDKNQLSAAYLYRFLDLNKENELVARMKGMANVTLPLKEIAQIEIPVPSLIEQKEFVENYEILENKSELISAELTHQITLVKKLRQQLLQDAVQGKLVTQDANDEPASVLLKKIKAEKALRQAQGTLKKEKELSPIKPEEIPFEIPENWVWCRLGEILFELKYGTSQSCDYDNTKNSPVLRIPNVSSGILNGNDLKYTNLNSKERIDLALEENDILIIRSNGSRDLVGRTVLVHSEFIGFAYAGYLIRLRFNKKLIGSKYLLQATSAPYFRELIETPLRTTVGINNINTEEISNLLIPFPPILEHDRIATKLEELMQYCNNLEASIKQSESQNEILLQQVLREALRKEEVAV